jgi:hypothetical protein
MATFIVAGCGNSNDPTAQFRHIKGATVSGVVVQNGKPIKPMENETISVSLCSVGEQQAGVLPAGGSEIKPDDGGFTILGPSSQGIPAGKYRVMVSADIYGGASGNPNRFEALAKKTPPLTVEVGPEDGQAFEIDIGKWTAKKR